MTPNLIETYGHHGQGYDPYFIKDNWQVAQLNYMPLQGLTDIGKMDMHQQTDEVFILIQGRAVLIAAEQEKDAFSFECIDMKRGLTYNIPVNVWHNIAMDEHAKLIIVEKSYTHTSDCIYKPLNEEEKIDLSNKIRELLNT